MSEHADIIKFLEMFRTEIHEGRATAIGGVEIDDDNRTSVVQILGWVCNAIETGQPAAFNRIMPIG